MQVFSIESEYPLIVDGEGARANFLHESGNILVIAVPDISNKERMALKKNKIKCGLIIDQPVILFLFDVEGFGEIDAPFDSTLYKKTQLCLPDITNKEQRLLIDIHVVDYNTKILKVLRSVTMPPDLTLKFLSAVQDQIAMPFSKSTYEKKLSEFAWQDIRELMKKTKMYNLGE
jgi:hypothetical protein